MRTRTIVVITNTLILMIHQVSQHAMHQSRSANNLGLTPEMQLQEAMQRQQSKQMQAQFSALQQQRLLQGLPQQHLHDTTSLQLQQLQQQQHHQQLQLQQQQANFLQSGGQCDFTSWVNYQFVCAF